MVISRTKLTFVSVESVIEPSPQAGFAKTISAFREGLTRELEAQKRQARRSDILVTLVERLESKNDRYRTSFETDRVTEQLIAGANAKLLADEDSEIEAKIVQVEGREIVLSTEQSLTGKQYRLSLSPWFLFERLQSQLDVLESDATERQIEAALQAFGVHGQRVLVGSEFYSEALNEGQNDAVSMALGNSTSRIWGPPGTGKTTTLAVLIEELVERDEQVLLTSNTHAALDQVLSGILKNETLAPLAESGKVIRLGRCLPEHSECEVRRVTRRLNAELRSRWERSESRLTEIKSRLDTIEGPLAELKETCGPNEQLALFEMAESEGLSLNWLQSVFAPERAKAWSKLSLPSQYKNLSRHDERLRYLRKAHRERIANCREALMDRQRQTISQAKVVLSTLANLTTSKWMDGLSFDTVIIEEAGMALLPGVFLAATRSQKRLVAVGDPCQLPSILTSRDHYVHRTLGRNIFEVGEVPKAMLNIQYRMHPEIADLVSNLSYEDQLKNGKDEDDFAEWTGRDPLEGGAVAGFDLHGTSLCQKRPGEKSRFNEESARVCLKLAGRAVAAGFEEIAIITPYRQQVRTIRKLLGPELQDIVEVDTVHRYQGKERAMIIIDLVDGEAFGPGTLIRDDRGPAAQLLNVAFSRAKYKLFLVGELTYLCRHSPHSFVGRAVTFLAKRKKLFKVKGK